MSMLQSDDVHKAVEALSVREGYTVTRVEYDRGLDVIVVSGRRNGLGWREHLLNEDGAELSRRDGRVLGYPAEEMA